MPRLDPATRNIAIDRLQVGDSQNEVARTLNVNHRTISRPWNRFQQTGSTNNSQRSGRPRITTPGQDQYIRIFHLPNRTIAASITGAGIPGLRRISSQIVHNRLRQHDIRPRRPYFGAILTPLHRRKRVSRWNRLRGWTFRELIVVFICFMESLSFFVFVLSRSYHCLYLFDRGLIILFICFMESLSLFLFVLWRAYRCFYLFYGEFIVFLYLFYRHLILVCICFIEILSLFGFVLSRS
jgi:hypothetical protein